VGLIPSRKWQFQRAISRLVHERIFVGIGQLFMLLNYDASLAHLVTSGEDLNSEKYFKAYQVGRLAELRFDR
jgi:hypothetical protein